MNIYNLHDFKCTFCSKWFNPHHNIPFSLPCSHSICTHCLSFAQKKAKASVVCPHHRSSQSFANVKVNLHIQQALQRLLKNSAQSAVSSNFNEKRDELDRLLKQRQENLWAFTQLLEQIYSNQINRILSLKSRVMRQLKEANHAFSSWKNQLQTTKDSLQLQEESKVVEEKVREFADLNLQEMAQIVIAEPAICLQRQFNIYNLIKKQERKTLKSSMKPMIQRTNKSLQSSHVHNDKENVYINFVKTVDSPIKQSINAELCKQLSSFKLQDSVSPNNQSRVEIERNGHRREKTNQSTFWKGNGESTIRDFQQSKCLFKSKVVPNQREKRSSDKFEDLISSLKSSNDLEQLIYSPDCDPIEQELLLLSDKKDEVNFLKQHEFQHKKCQREVQVRQRPIINCEKEKNKYIKRMQAVRTEQAFYNTNVNGNTIELFHTDLKEVNLKVFLDKFDWKSIQVIKFIGTGLQDHQLNQILNYMINAKVHSLLLSNNELEEISLDAILRFTELNRFLKTVSLQRNSIHQLHSNSKAKLALLKKRGVIIYI